MIYNDYYNIDFLLNKKSLQITSSDVVFSIHDSIHSFYPTATVLFNDITGSVREYLLPIEGNIFTIIYGTELNSKSISCNYVSNKSETPQSMSNGLLNGRITQRLTHEYNFYEETINKAYAGKISTIVSSTISDYTFSKKNIDATGSESTWYRLTSTQKDFIENVLIPNSYSDNSNNTPYFCFITVDNIFNYVHYYTLTTKSSIATLYYAPIKQSSIDINAILDIKPFNNCSNYKLRNRKVLTRSPSDGTFTTTVKKITDCPSNNPSENKFPVIYNKNLNTSFEYYLFNKTDLGEKEALKARILDEEREGLFTEKFQIITAFNPELKSGENVDLDLNIMGSTLIEKSLYSSGKYLIEDCIHSWDGSIKKGFTTIIVSRKYAKVPSNYLLSSKL